MGVLGQRIRQIKNPIQILLISGTKHPVTIKSIPYNRPAFHVSVPYRVLIIVNLSYTFLLNYHVCISGTEDPVKIGGSTGSANHPI